MPRSDTMETLQVPSELDSMLALYREEKPKRVLEIGCWDGGTLREWILGAVDGAVVCAIDLEHRNSDAYEEWVGQRGGAVTLHTHVGSSLTDEGIGWIRSHAPFDWVLVDGDHSDHGCRTDVATCLPLVRAGGIMLIHDITPADGIPGVNAPTVVFDELSAEYETWAFQDPAPAPWTRGIGVVRLPK